jgi:hypothetical protein
MSVSKKLLATTHGLQRHELVRYACLAGDITQVSTERKSAYLFGQTQHGRAVCLAWGNNLDEGCVTLEAVRTALSEIVDAGLKIPFIFFGRRRLCREGSLFTFVQVPWCFEQSLNLVVRALGELNRHQDLHLPVSVQEGVGLLAARRETEITRFLRDYHEARRELAEKHTFSIGHWPGRTIETEQQFHEWLLCGLDRKINTHGGLLDECEGWRRWDDLYQGWLKRDQYRLWQIMHTRERIYQFETAEVRSRFGHLLARYEDDE